jgi:hypothetical protein
MRCLWTVEGYVRTEEGLGTTGVWSYTRAVYHGVGQLRGNSLVKFEKCLQEALRLTHKLQDCCLVRIQPFLPKGTPSMTLSYYIAQPLNKAKYLPSFITTALTIYNVDSVTLMVALLVNKFPTFKGNRRYTAVFKRTTSGMHSLSPQSTLIWFYHLHRSLPHFGVDNRWWWTFTSSSPTILYAFLMSFICATCSDHRN